MFKQTLGKDVIDYMLKGIEELPTRTPMYTSFKQIRNEELKLMGFALLIEGYCRNSHALGAQESQRGERETQERKCGCKKATGGASAAMEATEEADAAKSVLE